MSTERDIDIVREKIRQLIRLRRYRLTPHAEERSVERNVRVQDILAVLQNPLSLTPTAPERWRIEGLDLDEDALTLIAEILEDILIITVF